MDAVEFIKKWSKTQLSERSASSEHFIDLCNLVGVQTPAAVDPVGDTFTFEKGAKVSAPASAGSKGERGWADVWYRGRFAWEYKRKDKHKTLEDAYRQLQQYREDLENPPLLIVCDITRTEIHTNFTGYKPEVHTILLEELGEAKNLGLLRRVFTEPESFRPTETVAAITEKIAARIGTIAQAIRDRGHDPHDAAHFLMKVMFCLFAEDVRLLPKDLFQSILSNSADDPERLESQMNTLFAAMRTGGDFGVQPIAHFNGGLFDEAPAIRLTEKEAEILLDASKQDWSAVEPSIFGTLFERSLDPSKRAQIGAHYTSREDIMLVIEPVIVRPLRREWDEAREQCDALAEQRAEAQRDQQRGALKKGAKKPATYTRRIEKLLFAFQDRLAGVRVLDPACGSGNFLYVAIQQLLALEKEVITHAADLGAAMTPRVRPTQLAGIEISPYAAELAQVVIWIGYLQWMRDNGFNAPRDPILEPIESIENRDAILAWTDENGKSIAEWRDGAVCYGKAPWPEADFIVGNPPFLGRAHLREGLGDSYVDALKKVFGADLPIGSDYCCYWFDHGRRACLRSHHASVGLLATQGIRSGSSRRVLQRIATDVGIMGAHSDLPWFLEGAAVRISIIWFGFRSKRDELVLNGEVVEQINADLSTGLQFTSACKLPENRQMCFRGSVSSGQFDLPWPDARDLLASPTPTGASNLDVLRPWRSGSDVLGRSRGRWIVDFGVDRDIESAASYDGPFAWVEKQVKVVRDRPKRGKKSYAHSSKYPFWQLWNPRPELRDAVGECTTVIVTPALAKHRVFWCLPAEIHVSQQLYVVASESAALFGILHGAIHEIWTLTQNSQLEDRPRYKSGTCFETFPLPWPPGAEPAEGDPQRPLHDAIADAARALDTQRERWLNPPEWVEQVAAAVDAADDFADVARVSGEEARRLIRQSAIDAAAAKDPRLKKRTLTNLYNERPTWLRLAHKALDEAVLGAYAGTDPDGAWDPAWAKVFEETGAGQPLPETDAQPHPLSDRRAEVEQAILGDLLRLNQQRAAGTP